MNSKFIEKGTKMLIGDVLVNDCGFWFAMFIIVLMVYLGTIGGIWTEVINEIRQGIKRHKDMN